MKVVCSKDLLVKGLNTVLRAVPVRTTMDILKCVLLQAEDGTLKLTANDTSLGIETRIEAEVRESGYVAIDAALFSSIVRKLPDSDVLITADRDNGIVIQCEKANFKISGRGADDFVYLPDVSAESSIRLSQFTLRDMINKVIFSISDSDLNAAMSGVYVEVLGEKLRMTTLDGHRISVRVSELNADYGRVSAIVPGKTFIDLSRILNPDNDKEMKVSFARNHIVFEFDQTKMVSRVIEGEYFKIESMLREEHETLVKINKKEFLNCLDRSTLLINEGDKKPVILDIQEEEMNIRLKSAIGSMNEIIPIEMTGKNIKIAFNPKLLIDALRVIDDEEIEVYFVKYNYPCTIKDQAGTYSYVVLPVNFTEE